jgi:uncharacterized membrane protein (DUF4010 family)
METFFQQGAGLDKLPLFLTSLAIGLLIGLERERNPSAKAGLRTFTLIALFGAVTGLLSDQTGSAWVLGGGLLIVGLLIIAAYLRDPDLEDPGTTTIAALLICYGLGAMVWYGYSTLAVMLAILTTMLLYFKPELRGITEKLSRRDLLSILQFAVLSFIILPILPDRDYGPYQALNPHQVWLMVVLISGLSLAGYVALMVIGRRYGATLLGFLGGLASSTATTLIYSRHGRSNETLAQLAVVVILLANLVVLVRLALVSSLVAPRIIPVLVPVLGAGLLLGLAGTYHWWRKLHGNDDIPMPEVRNPAEIKTALGFGLLYGVVLFFAAWLSDVFGNAGLYTVALVSGLTDVDAITLSSLRLFELGKLDAAQTVTAITLAVLSNLGFKFGMIVMIGGRLLASRCALGFGGIALGSGAALFLL